MNTLPDRIDLYNFAYDILILTIARGCQREQILI